MDSALLIAPLTRPKGWGIFPAQHVSISRSSSDSQSNSYLVTRWHPSSLLDQLLRVLVNLRSSLNDLINGGILPGTSTLNVAQGLLKTSQLNLNLALGLLRVLQSNLFEALDSFDLLADIVGLWLEGLVVLLDLVDDLRVLEDAAIMLE